MAALESFIQHAYATIKGRTTDWKPISPEVVPATTEWGHVHLSEAIGHMRWTDGERLRAFDANSHLWFLDAYAGACALFYMEKIKVSDIFATTYVKHIYENGVANTEKAREIAANFAGRVKAAILYDKSNVAAEETRLRDLVELLGEHNSYTKSILETALNTALYA